MTPLRLCAVVPTRNHYKALHRVKAALCAHGFPVIIVDDGSEEPAQSAIAALGRLAAPQAIQDLDLQGGVILRTNVNLGKGSAVAKGMRLASKAGFTHVLQVDADGQHDLSRLAALIDAAKARPEALIAGQAVYDASVPRVRRIARWVTHVWVWIETLSFQIRDSMCGFRVYPVAPTLAVLDSEPVGRGMDFDTEIMVRLFWRGVAVVQVPVPVAYPEGNTSNFRLWRDNWLITKMHTRLFFGMLARLPGWTLGSKLYQPLKELTRHSRRATAKPEQAGNPAGDSPKVTKDTFFQAPPADSYAGFPAFDTACGRARPRMTEMRRDSFRWVLPPSSTLPRSAHWASIQERGAYWGLQTLVLAARVLGRNGCRVLLVPVVGYFFVTGKSLRAYSRAFLERAHARKGLPLPTLRASWRHVMNFATKSLDAFLAWSSPARAGAVEIVGAETLDRFIAENRGVLLIVSHLGNAELCRATIARHISKPIQVLLHTRHAVLYNRILRAIRPDVEDHTIQVTELGPATAIDLSERIARGEWIAIAGDRTPVIGQARTAEVPFLGEGAPFSLGPYILAALMGCPVYLLFCLREDDRHVATFELFAERIELPRRDKDVALRGWAARYAERLEHYALKDPLQWYNFYDFWDEHRTAL